MKTPFNYTKGSQIKLGPKATAPGRFYPAILQVGKIYTVDHVKLDHHSDSTEFDQVVIEGLPEYVFYTDLFENADLPDIDSSAYVGPKYDEGKLLFRPLMNGLALPLKAVAAVLSYGAQKYAEDSWQKVPSGLKRYEDAFYRHQNQRSAGEVYDEESGLPHIAHMITNLMFMLWFEIKEGIIDNISKFNNPRK